VIQLHYHTGPAEVYTLQGRWLYREHSGQPQTPRYWRFVEEFPMTVTGKVQKFRLRDLAVEQLVAEAAPDPLAAA
jgi:fatty-acyl-CoA synthase